MLEVWAEGERRVGRWVGGWVGGTYRWLGTLSFCMERSSAKMHPKLQTSTAWV